MSKFDEALEWASEKEEFLDGSFRYKNPIPINHRRNILTALTQAAEIERGDKVVVDGWKPIESAPKDDNEVIMAFCVAKDNSWQEWSIVPAHAVRSILLDDLHFFYTHCMPLPPPPKGQDDQ